jgi:hypothetical protein
LLFYNLPFIVNIDAFFDYSGGISNYNTMSFNIFF